MTWHSSRKSFWGIAEQRKLCALHEIEGLPARPASSAPNTSVAYYLINVSSVARLQIITEWTYVWAKNLVNYFVCNFGVPTVSYFILMFIVLRASKREFTWNWHEDNFKFKLEILSILWRIFTVKKNSTT